MPSRARKTLNRALKAEARQKYDVALFLGQQALRLAPHNLILRNDVNAFYNAALLHHLSQGYIEQRAGDKMAAGAEFRMALTLDPRDQAAIQALDTLFAEPRTQQQPTYSGDLMRRAEGLPLEQAASGRHSFHFRGGARELLRQIATAYGMKFYIEDAVPDRNVRFDVTDLDFQQALQAVDDALGVTWTPLSANVLYIGQLKDAEKFRHVVQRTLYPVGSVTRPQLVDISQVLRVVLNLQQVQINSHEDALVVRGLPQQLDAAQALLHQLEDSPGDVMFKVQFVETDGDFSRSLGVTPPGQFQLLPLAPLLSQLGVSNISQALAILQNPSLITNLLNNQQLMSQLQQMQSQLAPLLNNPFVLVGGGTTLSALTIPNTSVNFGESHSLTRVLQTVWLRSTPTTPAELKDGEKYPIVAGTSTPILFSSTGQNLPSSASQAIPMFQYQDLGLDLKLKPAEIDGDHIVTAVHIKVLTLSNQILGANPIIDTREFQSTADLQFGEPVLVMGALTTQEVESLVGLPGLSAIPALGRLFSTAGTQHATQRLSLVITPYRLGERTQEARALWYPPDVFSSPGSSFTYQPNNYMQQMRAQQQRQYPTSRPGMPYGPSHQYHPPPPQPPGQYMRPAPNYPLPATSQGQH